MYLFLAYQCNEIKSLVQGHMAWGVQGGFKTAAGCSSCGQPPQGTHLQGVEL